MAPGPAVTSEQERIAQTEVAKPSIIFTAQETTNGKGQGTAGSEPITNFGLEPGFHIAAYLESSASTIGGAPAVAIVEYDYVRDGHVLIPAGSRAVGTISDASSTGIVSLTFTQLYLPDGTRIPISAVGLDDQLRLLKGKVTGKNTGKQLLLAALTGIGTMGAGFASGSSSGAITEQQLMEEQMAANTGNGVNQVVQEMNVTQHIVVTVPAGARLFITFIAPQRGAGASSAVR